MTVAITGTTGRVGRALADHFQLSEQVIELPRTDWDLADPRTVDRIMALDFHALLLPAAITSLERCEDDPHLAHHVNCESPARLARACAVLGRKVIFFSTDYVLAGEAEGLHPEDEPTSPASVYARTKAEAEKQVLSAHGCVMRVSWVFGPQRPAFPDMIVDRALAGEPLAAVCDKTSLPCYTKDLCEWTQKVLSTGCPNEILHACQSGEPVSWHGMACEIVDHLMEIDALGERPEITPLALDEMDAFKAVRPRHTAMSTSRLQRYLDSPPRHWQLALREYIDSLSISR